MSETREMLTDIETRKRLIRNQKCFMALSEKEVDMLATLLVDRTYMPGNVIVKEGETVDSIYLIVNGDADVFKSHTENHVEHNEKVATLHEGNAIGLSDYGFFSLTGRRTASVIAATEMTTLRLSVVVFRGFALAYPHANQVMREQAEQFRS